MYSIGKVIKQLRIKQGLSLVDLADRLNTRFGSSVNKGMISKWENGLTDPKLDNVRQIAQLFNVSLDEMLELKGNEIVDKDQRLAIDLLAEIEDPEAKKEAINYLKYLTSKKNRP